MLRLDQNKVAVFVIDYQEKLLPHMVDSDIISKNTQSILKTAKTLSIPVVYTEQYPKGLGNTIPEIKQLLDENNALGAMKMKFSGLKEVILNKLRELEIEQVIVVGIESHVCVFQTVRDLIENEFEVFFVEDAISSRTNKNKETGFYLMDKLGAYKTSTESIIFDLLGSAINPYFKEIQSLIK